MYPQVDQDFDVFVTVLFAWDSDSVGSALSYSQVVAIDDIASGTVVHRPNEPDTVAIFNAQRGPILPSSDEDEAAWDPSVQTIAPTAHLINSSTVVSVKAWLETEDVVLYLCDLDPETDWELRVDGTDYYYLSVDSGGMSRVEISNIGADSHIFDVYDGISIFDK